MADKKLSDEEKLNFDLEFILKSVEKKLSQLKLPVILENPAEKPNFMATIKSVYYRGKKRF